ncbi:MAG TPA: bifunctional phosphopantothenoylcysteine decarboxylase/phosphopantothenate--cysteine ligase CoaBC [Steroidobacteraceae bacterium]|nr:bifunctional phosphopantothenoylcysteine decarboxylase/phosphopantothenate--cysteine ligase CoaBC [Steroidobacteraceae bacterium]
MSSSVRHILLGVTGGIAAYKSAEVVRRLKEQGAEVQVVMTRGAREFVTELTFQALSGRPVRSELWDKQAEAAMGHIELARWADEVVIAPASADFIARLAHGLADDLLSTLCLATTAPITIAPAMNHVMWNNAATQANVAQLKQRGVRVLGPAEGDQACGESGPGRMLEPTQIVEQIVSGTKQKATCSFAGAKAIVTAGPTREKIDPVRFITNRSSGKMGFAIAAALRDAGANVVLISGPVNLPTPDNVTRINVESAEQMLQAVQQHIDDAQLFVATAAVSDYRAAKVADQKIKKGNEPLQLELARTPDILATISASKQKPFLVGFAAETENVEANALKKLNGKSLDMIAANKVGEGLAFDCDDNALTVYWKDGKQELCKCSKQNLARQLVQLIHEHYRCRSNVNASNP